MASRLSNLGAALQWYAAGLQIVPTIPGTKQPAVKWDPWLVDLCPKKIEEYWTEHPDHEIAALTGDGLFVLDADSPAAIDAVLDLMKQHSVESGFIVTTKRGRHWYFKRPPGVHARQWSCDSNKQPDGIDIRTDRSLISLPPSQGKRVFQQTAMSMDALSTVDQKFVDAIYAHNGQMPPRLPSNASVLYQAGQGEDIPGEVAWILEEIDPDCSYDDWYRIGMAIHHVYAGSDEGFIAFDEWSAHGQKYPGARELGQKWNTFGKNSSTPVTLGTMYDIAGIAYWSYFPDVVDIEVATSLAANPLRKYTLLGKSAEFEAEMADQCFALGGIAIVGQWTVIYAPPGTGKTLLVIWLLIVAIRAGDIDPNNVYYVNADDNHRGLTEKLKLAEDSGFHILAPAYQGLTTNIFLGHIREIIESDSAHGVIIILDTLKKFTDPMDKSAASRFGNLARLFVSKGGTLITLAHTNKNRGADGKPIPGGTSDIIDDADCAYVLDEIADEQTTRVVEFENRKSRGSVLDTASYRYATSRSNCYQDLLDSVEPIDDQAASRMREQAVMEHSGEAEITRSITEAISAGTTGKTSIVNHARKETGKSRARVEEVLDKYTGDNPFDHQWNCTNERNNKFTYVLLLDEAEDDLGLEI